jgi:organic hydroperoxide reductase OsmC/OhrA
MSKNHTYQANIVWTGNKGEGTRTYTAYSRAHEISVDGKPVIPGSSDPHFRGDESRYNPEEMLVASLSACHLLWYLHLCSDAGIVVLDYKDEAIGKMVETETGGGHFTEVILRPRATVTPDSDKAKAFELHEKAHRLCFIAASVNFPVRTEPTVIVADQENEQKNSTPA